MGAAGSLRSHAASFTMRRSSLLYVEDVGKPCGRFGQTQCGEIGLHICPQSDDHRPSHGRGAPEFDAPRAATTYSTSSLASNNNDRSYATSSNKHAPNHQ